MSQKPPAPFFEKFDAFVKKMQGVATHQHRKKDKTEPEKRRFATFQDRVMASVIDMGVIYVLLQDVFHAITVRVYALADLDLLAQAAANKPAGMHPLDSIQYQLHAALESGLLQMWLLNSFVQSLIVGVILVLVWREFNTTLGKYIIGLEFAGRNGEGAPSTRTFLLRYLGFYLSMPPLMLGFVVLGLDKQKRALHDRIAGTSVIYSARGSVFRQIYNAIKKRFQRRDEP